MQTSQGASQQRPSCPEVKAGRSRRARAEYRRVRSETRSRRSYYSVAHRVRRHRGHESPLIPCVQAWEVKPDEVDRFLATYDGFRTVKEVADEIAISYHQLYQLYQLIKRRRLG